MSKFNTDHICPECNDRERAHPDYAAADAAEIAAVRAGQMNFVGVGCPPDLYLPNPNAGTPCIPAKTSE